MTELNKKVNSKFAATVKNVELREGFMRLFISDIVSECNKVQKDKHKIDIEYDCLTDEIKSIKVGDRIRFNAQYEERNYYANGYQLFSPRDVTIQ